MIIGILLLAFFVRLVNLNQSLWLDESIEVLAVKSNSYWSLLTKYSLGDFHPPLYHFILKFWTDLFGYSEIAARIPSVIFGVGTVFFVYLIAKTIWNKKTAVIAGVFFALSPLAIYYSQEARMYSLAAFAISGAFYFFLKKRWIAYAIFFLIALYTDYLPFLMFPVFFLLSANKKKFVIYHLSFIVFFLPWLPLFLKQLHVGTSVAQAVPAWQQVVGAFSLKALPLTFIKFIIGRITITDKFQYALIFFPISAIYGYILFKAKDKLVWSWLIIPLVLGLLGSIFLPIFSYFRFIFVLPSFVLLLAKGSISNKFFIFFVIIISVISIVVFNLNPNFQRENWRDSAIYTHSDPGLVVMPNVAQSAPLAYYAPQQLIVDQDRLKSELNSQNNNKFKTIYLFRYVQELFDPADNEKKLIESAGFVKVQEKSFTGGVLIWKYQK